MNCFHAQTRQYFFQVQLFVVGLVSFMLSLNNYLLNACDPFSRPSVSLDKSRKLLSNYFVN